MTPTWAQFSPRDFKIGLMCTNFTPTTDTAWVKRHFSLDLPALPNPEVYPGQMAPIAYLDQQGQLQIELAQFGLLPSWVDESRAKTFHRHTYNARIESVQAKPSFRQAFSRSQWAVLLVDDFFEPCYESGSAVRHRINTSSGEPFGVACLWDRWSHPHEHQDLEVPAKTGLLSFTMITLNANGHPVMSRMHPPEDEKRMPWVMLAAQFQSWLKTKPDEVKRQASSAHLIGLKDKAHPRSALKGAQPSKVSQDKTGNPAQSSSQLSLF